MALSRPQTVRLQAALVAQGYSLPRWGVDGALGSETLAALDAWRADHGAAPLILGELSEQTVHEVEGRSRALQTVTPGRHILDVRARHPGRARKGTNPWIRIDTVCLHQMACRGPGGWERWRDLAIHFAILAEGAAAWLYDCDALLWHGHGWNGRSVGLEFEGWFAGVEGRPGTLWAPEGAPAAPAAESGESELARLRAVLLETHQGCAGKPEGVHAKECLAHEAGGE
jgi:hypothetical protein